MKQRKKICPQCGQRLWLKEFYKDGRGYYSSLCKHCRKQQFADLYRRTRKVPDGTYYHKDLHRIVVHEGKAMWHLWNNDMLFIVRKYYPTSPNNEVAEMCGVSVNRLIRKARELGLRKDSEYLSQVRRDATKMYRLLNK
jgi:hypothetical protein